MQLTFVSILTQFWQRAWLLTGLPFSGHTISTLARELCIPHSQAAARESKCQIVLT